MAESRVGPTSSCPFSCYHGCSGACALAAVAAHDAGCLQFFGNHPALADRKAFLVYLAPLHDTEWVVYAKKPFGGPEQVLRYMARYTHRVAIDDEGASFKWKDYRVEGPARATKS